MLTLGARGDPERAVNVNAYHNLAGWLRDAKAVLGDRNDLADLYYGELDSIIVRIVGEYLDAWLDEHLGGDDEPDPEELEPEDADADVPVQRLRDGGELGEDARRTRTRSDRTMGGAARVADPLPRDLRQPTGNVTGGDAAAVAGARCGLKAKRVATVEVSLAEANKRTPRPTRASSRSRSKKGGKRGTRKATR